jgi:transposase
VGSVVAHDGLTEVDRDLDQTLLADVPELGRLNRKQIAALVGVAPRPAPRSPRL